MLDHNDEMPSEVRGWLEGALAHDGNTHTIADVVDEIRAGRAYLWYGPRSAVVTRVHDLPRAKELRIWLAGGDLDELLEQLDLADLVAKRLGCSRVVVEGRKGWGRVMRDKGYKETAVILSKEL